jgi:hypothetical protein
MLRSRYIDPHPKQLGLLVNYWIGHITGIMSPLYCKILDLRGYGAYNRFGTPRIIFVPQQRLDMPEYDGNSESFITGVHTMSLIPHLQSRFSKFLTECALESSVTELRLSGKILNNPFYGSIPTCVSYIDSSVCGTLAYH